MSLRRCVPSVAMLLLISALLAAAPATEQDAAPPRVTLPKGWVAKPSPKDSIAQLAEYPELGAYFELFVEPTENYPINTTLEKWATRVQSSTGKRSLLTDRTETDLREGQIAGQQTMEYEVTGQAKEVKLHFRFIMLRVGDCFCKITCWTTPDHWDAAQAKFEELVKNLK